MAWFTFGKKSQLHKTYSLHQIPLFSDLSPAELKSIEKRARLVEFHRGDRVYSQGDAPDAFYVVISGRFRAMLKKGGGAEQCVANFYRGDYFGEISTLTNKPHSVTVEALNDALSVRIARDAFSEILAEVPSLSLHLSRLLGRRLVERDERRVASHAEIVAVYSLSPAVAKSAFITNLAVTLSKDHNRQVIVVDLKESGTTADDSGPVFAVEDVDIGDVSELERHVQHHRHGFDYMNIAQMRPIDEQTELRITFLLTFLVSRYQFVLVDLMREIKELAYKALSQSDIVYLLTDDETQNLEKCRTLIKELKDTLHVKDGQIKVLLWEKANHPHLTIRQQEHITEHPIFYHQLPMLDNVDESLGSSETPLVIRDPRSPYSKTVRYLARDLCNALVGLALGSGAAFGLAHIGVLRALEEEGIPIDVIAGSSIGSLIGAFWATGMKASELEELAKSFNLNNSFFRLVGFGDMMVPHWGIFKGNRMEHFLRQYLGQARLENLKIPLRVVATNLATSEPEIFSEGDLVKAVRASCSIPGIFRAVRANGKVLVDGGIAAPLPVDVLIKMGVKKIIAVNVLSGPKDHTQRREVFRIKREALEQQIKTRGPWRRFLFDLERRFMQNQVDNIFNVLMSTIQFMEYSIADGAGLSADVLIHPVVIDSHWAEFYSAEKFIRAGEEKTREVLKEIRSLLET